MLNPSRNSDTNKTSTYYKGIIQFWRHYIAKQGKNNIDNNICEPSKVRSILPTKLRRLFFYLRPNPSKYVCMYVCTYTVYLCMYVCVYIYSVCMYICVYVCIYLHMYVCMYVSTVYVHVRY